MLCGAKKQEIVKLRTIDLKEIQLRVQEEKRWCNLNFLPENDWELQAEKTEEQLERERLQEMQRMKQEEEEERLNKLAAKEEKNYETKVITQQFEIDDLKRQREGLKKTLQALQKEILVTTLKMEVLNKMIARDQAEFKKCSDYKFS